MAHRDAIGHRDGGEFARRRAGFLHANLRRLCLTRKGDIARCRFIPAGSDAYQRLSDFLRRQAHRVIIGTMRRALRPHGGVPARQL